MGAGKSEAARAFRRLGAAVYDADILGHYALANSVLVKDGVKRLLGEHPKYMDARDHAGWEKYLKTKQKFI